MGSSESTLDKGIIQCVHTEFARTLKSKTRDYLILSEVLTLTHPEDFPFTFAHIGNLFVLDSDLDGRVKLSELEEFAMFCNKNLRNYKTYEFQSHLQAASTLELWKFIKENDNNFEDLVAWIGRLLYENVKNVYNHQKKAIKKKKMNLSENKNKSNG